VKKVAYNIREPKSDMQRILEEIRASHIDIIPIIWEVFNEFLLEYIEDIIRNVYQTRIVEVRQ